MSDQRWGILWVLVVLGFAGACGSDAALEVDTTPTRVLNYDLETGEPARLLVDGVAVEVVGDLKQGLSWHIENRSTNGSTAVNFMIITRDDIPLEERESEGDKIWLGVQRISAEGGTLRIGDTDFGSVTADDTVRIDAEGVFVNDELVGALPGNA